MFITSFANVERGSRRLHRGRQLEKQVSGFRALGFRDSAEALNL